MLISKDENENFKGLRSVGAENLLDQLHVWPHVGRTLYMNQLVVIVNHMEQHVFCPFQTGFLGNVFLWQT